MRIVFYLPLLLLLCFSSACSAVPRSSYEVMKLMPADASPAPFIFDHYEFDLAPDMVIGTINASPASCLWPSKTMERDYLLKRIKDTQPPRIFISTLAAQGYDVIEDDILPGKKSDDLRAAYAVAARITTLNLDICTATPRLLFPRRGQKNAGTGALYMEVDWTIYSYPERRIIYRTRTSGSGQRAIPGDNIIALLTADAFEMAAHNLGAEGNFHHLIVTGKRPPPP